MTIAVAVAPVRKSLAPTAPQDPVFLTLAETGFAIAHSGQALAVALLVPSRSRRAAPSAVSPSTARFEHRVPQDGQSARRE